MNTGISNDEFKKLCADLALGLSSDGGAWRFEPVNNPVNWGSLKGPDGQSLHVCTQYNDHSKLYLNGNYPGGRDYMPYENGTNGLASACLSIVALM